MKVWPLRARLTLWVASLVTGTLIIFGGLSAWSLYREEIAEFYEEPQKPPVTQDDFRAEADDTVEDLFRSYAISMPCAVGAAAFGVWFIMKKALRPVEEITEAAERIHAQALHQRLVEPKVQDEIGRLSVILNSMFDRLEKSFIQSSRFSADASHELKTPLTVMRAEIESALKRESADTLLLESLLEQTQRISGITSKLLLLARADAGQLLPELSTVDISGLCVDLLEDAEILAEGKKIQVEGDIAPNLELQGDELLLRQALMNMLDNAIKYNQPDGRVQMILRPYSDGVFIGISNTGSGIPSGHEAHIFERFYRVDASRSSETGGSGLGLSICREIVAAHGGRIKLGAPKEGWTTFVVELSRKSPGPIMAAAG